MNFNSFNTLLYLLLHFALFPNFRYTCILLNHLIRTKEKKSKLLSVPFLFSLCFSFSTLWLCFVHLDTGILFYRLLTPEFIECMWWTISAFETSAIRCMVLVLVYCIWCNRSSMFIHFSLFDVLQIWDSFRPSNTKRNASRTILVVLGWTTMWTMYACTPLSTIYISLLLSHHAPQCAM